MILHTMALKVLRVRSLRYYFVYIFQIFNDIIDLKRWVVSIVREYIGGIGDMGLVTMVFRHFM